MAVMDAFAGAAGRSNFGQQVDKAIDAAADWLAARQKAEGYWVGDLDSNACMEAQWILALWLMGLEDHPIRPRLANALRSTQRADGSWDVYYGAPDGDINATVEAYAALRAMGDRSDAPHMIRARGWIESRGGLKDIRVFTRYWLAMIGEWPWDKTPNLPPEVIFLPNWVPFSIYNFAQWARATLMPIAVLAARRPVRRLPLGHRLDELFPKGRRAFDYAYPKKPGRDLWDSLFLTADKGLHLLQSLGTRTGIRPGRESAIRRALEWIVQHQDADGVWGGIQPPWIYSLLALVNEGYALDHAVVARGLGALDDPRWRLDRGEASFIQASTSPVWDTILSLMALDDCELHARHGAEVKTAIEWVLSQQVLRKGDWSEKCPDLEPGGWAFEYKNGFYPDTDDTAVALMALAPFRDDPRIEEAIGKGLAWLIGMQSHNGGWGAFDKDNDKQILTKIPFCDFGEALDPPSVDVTAHIIEAFGKLGLGPDHPAMVRALDFVRAEQEEDGSWFGRWGVNYVYGTGAVLPALEAIGEDMSKAYIARAADWLRARQNPDGGWGESCASYMDPAMKGVGTSTASQTAWALMGLLAVNRPGDAAAIAAGTAYLTERQKDGSWDEPEYTGTGFPGYGVGTVIKLDDPALQDRLKQGAELSRAFMIRYKMYSHYFPMMALGRVRKRGLA